MSLSVYDYVVIVFYLIFMFSLGPVFKSFSKTASDYFRGGGNMLWWLVGCSSFMASFSAWAYTGGAAKAYETGTFFLLLYGCNICSLIFMFFFTAAKYRRMRIITAIEAVQKRYGKANEQIFTWLLIPSLLIFGGLSLYTISVFVAGALGISMELIIITLGIVITGMRMLGGSWAATAGDFIQMLVVLAITILMAARQNMQSRLKACPASIFPNSTAWS
jgi:Na+/proline symporter